MQTKDKRKSDKRDEFLTFQEKERLRDKKVVNFEIYIADRKATVYILPAKLFLFRFVNHAALPPTTGTLLLDSPAPSGS